MSLLRVAAVGLVVVALAVPHARGQGLEIDHVFIMTSARGPAMAALAAAGFRVRPDTGVHEGLGTAAFGIAFANAYLELVWVVDSTDFARNPFGMARRLTTPPGGSPVGIGLRRLSDELALPFETRRYHADGLLPGAAIEIAAWAGDIREPSVFVVDSLLAWTATLKDFPSILEFLPHPNGVMELTGVRVAGPALPVESTISRALVTMGLVGFADTGDQYVELVFDHGGRRLWDFRPALPLVIRYR